MSLSALGLRLNWDMVNHNERQLSAIVIAALENGINCFHFDYIDTKLVDVVSGILSNVDRNLIYISATAQGAPRSEAAHSHALVPLRERLKQALKGSHLEHLDLIIFEDPIASPIPEESWYFLDSLHRAQMIRSFGFDASDTHLKALILDGRFQVMRTSFNLDTNWEKRHLLDLATKHGIATIGRNYFPAAYQNEHDVVPKSARKSWFFFKPSNPMEGIGTFAFLYRTPEWTAEELCLGFALHQPCLSTIHIWVQDAKQIQSLCMVPERYLPPSVPAQIEMARSTSDLAKKRA